MATQYSVTSQRCKYSGDMEIYPVNRATFYLCGPDHDKQLSIVYKNVKNRADILRYDVKRQEWHGVTNTNKVAILRNFDDTLVSEDDFITLVDKLTLPLHTVRGPVFNPYAKVYIGCDKPITELYKDDDTVQYSALIQTITIIH